MVYDHLKLLLFTFGSHITNHSDLVLLLQEKTNARTFEHFNHIFFYSKLLIQWNKQIKMYNSRLNCIYRCVE